MSLYRRGAIWWVTITVNGRRIRRSTGESNQRRAQKLHDEWRAGAWRVRSAKNFLDAAQAWLRAGHRDPADAYRLRKLTALYSNRPLSEVTAESLEAVIPDSSAGTFNRYVNLVLAILNVAREKKWIDEVPRLRRKDTPEARVRWLTPEEWRRLEKALLPHQRDMARFAVATGLRQRNVFELEWSQVDLRRRRAWVHPDQAKARRAIPVPLSDEAVRVLRSRLGQHERWVFAYRGHPVTEIKTAFSKALQRAGIRDFTWHDLRHTWATWHLMNGTPIEVLKELGGWSDLRMVMRYAHLAESFVAQYAANSRMPRSQFRSQQKAK